MEEYVSECDIHEDSAWGRRTAKNWILKLAVVRILFPDPHMPLQSFIININYPVGGEWVNNYHQTSGFRSTFAKESTTCATGSEQPSFSVVSSILAPRERNHFAILFNGLFIFLRKIFWLYDFLDFPLLQPTITLKCEMYLKLTKAMSHPTSPILFRLEEVGQQQTECKAEEQRDLGLLPALCLQSCSSVT